MTDVEMQSFIKDTKFYIYDNFNLNEMGDTELEEAIEQLIEQQLKNVYVSIEQRALISQQIYHSNYSYDVFYPVCLRIWQNL